MPKTMTTISIDYTRYGYAKRVTIPLFERERALRVGDQVRVIGDDVPERTAVVVALVEQGRKAVLEFDEELTSPTP